MTGTQHTIRIRKEASRRLVFDVFASKGTLLARSSAFATICKLEVGLSALMAAARVPETAAFVVSGGSVSVTPGGQRRRVILEGEFHPDRKREFLAGILNAVVVDDRPVGERRADLSGPLCELSH